MNNTAKNNRNNNLPTKVDLKVISKDENSEVVKTAEDKEKELVLKLAEMQKQAEALQEAARKKEQDAADKLKKIEEAAAENLKKQQETAAEKEKFYLSKLDEMKKKNEEANKPRPLTAEEIKRRVEQTKYLSALVDKRNKILEKIKELKTFIFTSEEAQLTLIDVQGHKFETVKTELLTKVKETITNSLDESLAEIEKQIANFEI